jgi:hypothetical protein
MAKWDDELDAVLRGKGVDPTAAEEVADPGPYLPYVDEVGSREFYQVRLELRNYAQGTVYEINTLKDHISNQDAVLYDHDQDFKQVFESIEKLNRQIGNVWEAINNIPYYQPAAQTKSFWKNEVNYVWLGLITILVLAVVMGPVR